MNTKTIVFRRMKCMLLAFLLIAPFPVATHAASYSGNTFVYYGRAHGVQVEYYSANGRNYLWYPGNRRAVPGRWKLSNKKTICFQYGGNTYNPVTRKRGGRWECKPVRANQLLVALLPNLYPMDQA